jgi:hypothetical protein
VMKGNDVGWSPQLESSIISKELSWSNHHSDLQKPV